MDSNKKMAFIDSLCGGKCVRWKSATHECCVWEVTFLPQNGESSPRLMEALGCAHDEECALFAANWRSRIHLDDWDKLNCELDRYKNVGSPVFRAVHRLFCRNGQYTWVEATGRITGYTLENEVKGIIGTLVDITKIKSEQHEQMNTTKEVKTAFEACGLALILLKENRIELCNERFEEIFGYPRSEIMGSGSEKLFSDINTHEKIFLILKSMPAGAELRDEIQFVKKDGGKFDARVSFRLAEEARQEKRIVCAIENIS